MGLIEYLNRESAAELLGAQAGGLGVTEFARVQNLEYVFPPFELYPLAPRIAPPLAEVAAYLVDMDGTSTTTEPLALHALEYMVRRFTGRLDRAAWPGLDEERDLPYVIGNSNFRHVEFLVERYGAWLDPAALCGAFCEAVLWTLASLPDPQRRGEVLRNARHCGLADMLADGDFQRLVQRGPLDPDAAARLAGPLVQRWGRAFACGHRGALVAAALDVYYLRYHAILQRIAAGQTAALSRELFGTVGPPLVAPLPGYGVFVALLKGWLGAEAEHLAEALATGLDRRVDAGGAAADPRRWRARLAGLGAHFERRPARLALVTASIAHEAHAVMHEVVGGLAREVRAWPVSAERRERLAAHLADYRAVFDGFANASDAHEARLKPHRDLYSIALAQMSIPPGDYPRCVGLEDTEPGIVALRAAGIGCAVALPNHDTRRQDYRAAVQVVRGGLPELILRHNLLLGASPAAPG